MTIALAVASRLRALQIPGTGRLLAPFVPRQGTISTTYAGYQIDLDLSDQMQWQMALGCYERFETWRMRRELCPGMTVLDVGANVGHHTLYASRAVGPTGHVIAVEPYPWAADRLERTLRANGIQNVRLKRIGLTDRNGTADLPDGIESNHTASLLTTDPDRATNRIEVARLDDVLDEWVGRYRVVDFLKIDIEGGEPAFMRGAEKCLSWGRVRRILCEFNRPWLSLAGTTPEGLARDLRRLGFQLVDSWPDFERIETANLYWVHNS